MEEYTLKILREIDVNLHNYLVIDEALAEVVEL